MTHYGDFHAYFQAESKEEADKLFDRVNDATEEILCPNPGHGQDEDCGRSWTCGGRTGVIPEGEQCSHERFEFERESLNQELMTLEIPDIVCIDCGATTKPLNPEIILGPWESA